MLKSNPLNARKAERDRMARVAEARAALERADAGDEEIDRWHMEQRLHHAENKIAVAGR